MSERESVQVAARDLDIGDRIDGRARGGSQQSQLARCGLRVGRGVGTESGARGRLHPESRRSRQGYSRVGLYIWRRACYREGHDERVRTMCFYRCDATMGFHTDACKQSSEWSGRHVAEPVAAEGKHRAEVEAR